MNPSTDPRKGRAAIIELITVLALHQRRHELFRDGAALVVAPGGSPLVCTSN